MNKNDFRSAYDKIALPEDVKSEMKKKLLAQMSENKTTASDDAEAFYPATEIKLEPRKHNTGRIAAVVGSAAAIVLAVGAGFWFNRDALIPQPSDTVSTTEENSESTEEAIIEDGYFMKLAADGVLHFQEFTLTDAAHTQPSGQYLDAYSDKVDKIKYDGAYEFQERYRLIADNIGYNALYAAEEMWAGNDPNAEPNSNSQPLGKDVPLQEMILMKASEALKMLSTPQYRLPELQF